MATSYDRLRPRSETALRAEALLDRYPNLSEQELAELINLFPQLSLLDQGLLTADERLSGKLADFHRHHGRKLKTSKADLVVFLAFPAVLAMFMLWWVVA
ncbi:MAG: hypothetical protein ACXWU1_03305 [Allosphingosinicella sp.]